MARRPALKKKVKYRSGLEEKVVAELTKLRIAFTYESLKIRYQKKVSTYTPDIILSNGIILEVKGYFTAEDRAKHLLIKDQHPELDIRFVFQMSSKKIHKSSTTTYGDWCERYGFKYAEYTSIPVGWLTG